MNKKELFDKWVDQVMAYTAEVGPKINRHVAAMQGRPFFDRQSDILFLGINPAENGVYREEENAAARQRFYDGNCNPPETWGGRWNWAFNPDNPHNSFTKCGWGDAVRQGNYLFFNAVFFGSPHGGTDIATHNAIINRCVEFTAEAITGIFRPKCVICFSVAKVFDRLNGVLHLDDVHRMQGIMHEDGTMMTQRIMRGEKDGIRFYGVPHLSGARNFSKADFDAIIAAIHKDISETCSESNKNRKSSKK